LSSKSFKKPRSVTMGTVRRYTCILALAWTAVVVCIYLLAYLTGLEQGLLTQAQSILLHVLQYGLFWICGLGLVAVTALRARRRLLERDAAVSALWDSERRYRELMERTQTPTGVIQDDCYVYANPAFSELLCYDPGELVGRPIEETLCPEDAAQIVDNYQRRMRGEPIASRYETRLVRHDGTPVWVEVNAQKVEYEGAPADQVEFHDIDARKLAQEGLRRSEEQYRSLVESMREGIILADSRGMITFVNHAAARMVGYEPAEITGHSVFEITPPAEHSHIRDEMDLRVHGKGSIYETRMLRRDGSLLDVQVNATPRFDGAGGFLGPVILALDITERKQAEALLRESEAKFRAFAEQTVVGFLILQHGRSVYSNAAVKALVGFPLIDNMGWDVQQILQYVHPEDAAVIAREYAELVATGGEHLLQQFEFRVLTLTGETKWALLNATRTELGGVPSIIALIMDITERKLAEATMQQQQHEDSIATLAGGIAHDFNNILLGVLGSATLLADSLPANHPDRDLCGLIATSARRMSDLTAKLLAYARGGRYQPRPVDLNEMVRDVVAMLRGSQPGQVQVVLTQASQLWPVEADPGQMQQVLLNLIFNGYESMAAGGGTVSVLTENVQRGVWTDSQQQRHPAGDYVHIAVRDCGPGMDQATLARAFEPYFSTKATGRGLGLAAVLGIVRNHSGSISVDSTPGQGTVFHVYLPRGVSEVKRAQPEAIPGQGGHETVLVVDDEELVLDVARRILSRQGYTVLAALDGAAGLALAKQHLGAIDLALVDVQMPVMDGVELLGRLREIGYRGRFLLTSGYNYSLALEQLPPGSVDGFLNKPYGANDLLEAVRNALDGN
jgi:two-component system, cell cycle sensor histidine kinase and response regulator CckA